MDRLELPDVTWRRVSPRLVWVELVGGAGFLVVVLAAGVLMFLLQVWVALAALAAIAIIAIVNLALTPGAFGPSGTSYARTTCCSAAASCGSASSRYRTDACSS